MQKSFLSECSQWVSRWFFALKSNFLSLQLVSDKKCYCVMHIANSACLLLKMQVHEVFEWKSRRHSMQNHVNEKSFVLMYFSENWQCSFAGSLVLFSHIFELNVNNSKQSKNPFQNYNTKATFKEKLLYLLAALWSSPLEFKSQNIRF